MFVRSQECIQRWTENGAACSVGFEVVVVGASPVELGLLLLPVVTEVNPVAPVGLVERLDGVVLLEDAVPTLSVVGDVAAESCPWVILVRTCHVNTPTTTSLPET